MIAIYKPDGSALLSVNPDDSSYRYRTIMGEHTLNLNFSAPWYVDIPIGSYCHYQGLEYVLESTPAIKKNGERNFEYKLILQSDQHKLTKFLIRNTVPGDSRLKFSYTARPQEFLQLLIDNMNARDENAGWSFGDDYVVAFEKSVSFNHNTCMDALRMIAEAFETEWEIKGKTIYLRKVEYNKDNPLPMSYGRGNGFRPGLGRSEYTASKAVERLFVQGGDRNIDASSYRKIDATGQVGSRELLMPANTTIKYDGIYFEDEQSFNPESPNVHEYVTDESGASVTRMANEGRKGLLEGSLDASSIYPMREGAIASVIPINPAINLYDFTDDDPNIPDYSKYIIAGETMTVVFQTGMLAGKEFDVNYKHPGYFEIVPQTIDGIPMPNEQYLPVVGDIYAIFNVMLPDEYISSAERNMLKEAVKYLYENETPRFTFTGEVDGIWAQKNWVNVGGRLIPGGFIRFSDNQFLPAGMDIRITGIKDYVNHPHWPDVELSNNSQKGSWLHNMKRQINSDEVTTETKDRQVVQFTKRRFRDVKETTDMLHKSLLNFSEGISPITVRTMQTVVGDESLQFDYDAGTTNKAAIFYFDPSDEKTFHALAGTLTHKTLGIDYMSSSNAEKEYLSWEMPAFRSATLGDPDKPYFVYAKVEKAGVSNPDRRFLLSEDAIAMESVAGYYHLLVGILNSESDGTRSFAPMYGFTEITPGRVITDLIRSADGGTYFDLEGGIIGGNILFKDGLVSGDIGIGNDLGINAGMSGVGSGANGANQATDVRLWAGANKAGKNTAPFRVQHDGKMIASNAEIQGLFKSVHPSGRSTILIDPSKSAVQVLDSNGGVLGEFGGAIASSFLNLTGTFTKLTCDGNYIQLRDYIDRGNSSIGSRGAYIRQPSSFGSASVEFDLTTANKANVIMNGLLTLNSAPPAGMYPIGTVYKDNSGNLKVVLA